MTTTLVLIAACHPGDDPGGLPDAHPVADAFVLPPGVWEPAPGARIWDASLATENGTVWWAYGADTIQLTATSPTGASLVQPSVVDATGNRNYGLDLAITPSALVVAVVGESTLLRRYDRAGTPLGQSYAIENNDNARIAGVELVAKADGGAQFFTAREFEPAQVAIVDLDAAGTPTATFQVEGPWAGTATTGVAAATFPDGSTIIAWDRYHDGCHSEGPATAFMTVFDGANVGTPQTIRDLPDQGEAEPAIAAWDTTSFVAWATDVNANGSRIAIAKYPDVSTVLAELGDPDDRNQDVSIVLTAPDRGAIMWTAALTGTLNVVAFEERQGIVYVGASHVVPAVHAGRDLRPVGLVHVGGDRYVLGWIESTGYGGEETSLYATTIDLTGDAMRLAPPREVLPEPTVRTRPPRRRCV